MLTYIKGRLEEAEVTRAVIDVQVLGYELAIPATTYDRLPRPGAEIKLFVHPVIRDDEHLLYGFFSKEERSLFRLLISVNGVGPSIGVNILSSLPVSSLADCIQSADTKLLAKIKGIGKKTAERLVLELRDKVAPLAYGGGSSVSSSGATPVAEDAIMALEALGFRGDSVRKAVKDVCADSGDSLTSEQIIKLALSKLNS